MNFRARSREFARPPHTASRTYNVGMPFLLKTEPSTYSFADLERDQKTLWDGVSNPVALKHLRGMTKGERLLIYHTGDE
ncbi:MAG: EVE domain-containing protein, partial [Terriglobales bacterium]